MKMIQHLFFVQKIMIIKAYINALYVVQKYHSKKDIIVNAVIILYIAVKNVLN